MIDFGVVLGGAPLNWSPETAYEIASKLVRDTALFVDWDPESGEAWISILANKMRVGMVSTLKAVAIFADVPGVEFGQMTTREIVTVRVSSFDDPVIICDIEKLVSVFGAGALSITRGAPFSANDLWFATV